MTLADLVDLEAQLARDQGQDPARLHERDRALVGDHCGASRPHRAVALWLAALRAREPGRSFPGRRVVAASRLVAALLALAGLAAGAGAAAWVLLYDGERPVNVWDVLLVFVGAQAILLTLLVASFAFPLRSVGVPFLGTVRWLAQRTWHALAARFAGASAERAAVAAVLGRLRARHGLYTEVEAWSLLVLTQAFGVAFNVGALLTFLRLVVFSDIAFCWSTTLATDASVFHRTVTAIALPWATLLPDAVPTLGLVEATRWSRLEGAYVTGATRAGAVLSGGWWSFLFVALAVYGLLPRVVALSVALTRRAWLLGRLALRDIESRALLARLAGPHVSARAESVEQGAPGPATGNVPRAGTIAAGARCDLVLWRDIPADGLADAVRAQLDCEVGAVWSAGGRGDGAPRALPASNGPVVVAAEAWEAPDDALLELLAAARRAAGAGRPVIVFLTGAASTGRAPPAARDVAVWSRRLSGLADPHLAIEPLAERR